ncbi:hypothetical protein BJ742DRAFT_777290 [Cladochytrium replicatum]|nr:hypothetical protein BJ742DRAFT_777290 [Cladochytrium replicatum]
MFTFARSIVFMLSISLVVGIPLPDGSELERSTRPPEGLERLSFLCCGSKAATVKIPQVITPASGKLVLNLYAEGTQNYVCNATKGEWTFSRPEAVLFCSKDKRLKVGKHYFLDKPDAGGGRPTWELTIQPFKSSVTTKKIAGVASDLGADKAIDWLLTQATSHTGSTGLFNVSFVVRHKTKAGTSTGLKIPCADGKTEKQKYTAEYAFFV